VRRACLHLTCEGARLPSPLTCLFLYGMMMICTRQLGLSLLTAVHYQGGSPYQRSTYRYTPLLAWLLIPNITVHSAFGKLLFVLADLISGYLIYHLALISTHNNSTLSLRCSQLWLLNPLPIAVSTRGNAESVVATLVLLTLYFIINDNVGGSRKEASNSRNVAIGAVVYGLAVHVKIYPVTYSLPIYIYLNWCERNRFRHVSSSSDDLCTPITGVSNPQRDGELSSTGVSNPQSEGERNLSTSHVTARHPIHATRTRSEKCLVHDQIIPEESEHVKGSVAPREMFQRCLDMFLPTRSSLTFTAVSMMTFCLLTGSFYYR